MADTFNFLGAYQIDVSGWGLDNRFFVEKTDLHWSQTGDQHLLLRRSLPKGAMIFVRLLTSESMKSSLPVAYQVEGVQPMDCNGKCEMQLLRVNPRSKAPHSEGVASYVQEDSLSACEPRESSTQMEPEEVLQ
jgi:hypothetical protein